LDTQSGHSEEYRGILVQTLILSINLILRIENLILKLTVKLSRMESERTIVAGYNYKLVKKLGTLDHIINRNELISALKLFIEVLDDSVVYNIIPVVSWFYSESFKYKGYSLCKLF
jgi:hypothetical protein